MKSAAEHRAVMDVAEARGDALAAAWLEARASAADTRPIDLALADAVRDYRRAEGKHRRAARREAAAAALAVASQSWAWTARALDDEPTTPKEGYR